MRCRYCGTALPENANFCPECGAPAGQPDIGGLELKPRFDVFFWSILLTLGLTLVMVFVFGWPVLIFGAFLPLFWLRKKRD